MADTISTQIENQRLLALSLAGSANSALAALGNINTDLQIRLGPPGEVNVVPPDVNLDAIPAFGGRELTLSDPPTQGVLTSVPIPVIPSIPTDGTGAQPAFTQPSRPAQLPAFGGSKPTLVAPIAVADLDVSALLASIPQPVITTITVPEAQTLNLPEFHGTRPGARPTDLTRTDLTSSLSGAYGTALNIMNNTVGAQTDAWFARYFPSHAAGVTALEAQLATYLAGGTGVNSDVASAIYEIERGKREGEYRRLERSVLLDSAKRGFELDDGILLAARIGVRTAAADANATSAVELRKLLFELETKNLQFAVEQSRAWRTVAVTAYQGLLTQYVALNGQAIEYAKALLAAIIAAFNAAIEGYKADAEGYRIEATVFAEKLKVELAKLDIYRARLEAEKAKATVNEQNVKVYEARIRTVEAAANVYIKRLEGVVARAGIEKLKAEIFESEVRAFGSIAQAKEAEWRGYAADLSGQNALQQAWSETVRARVAELEGHRAHVNALTEQTKALVAYNDGVSRLFENATRAYEAQARAEIAIIGSDVDTYKTEIAGVAASNEAKGRIASLSLEQWRTGRDIVLKKSEQEITRAKLEADSHMKGLELQIRVADAMAQNASRMAQAALAGINSILSSSQTSTV